MSKYQMFIAKNVMLIIASLALVMAISFTFIEIVTAYEMKNAKTKSDIKEVLEYISDKTVDVTEFKDVSAIFNNQMHVYAPETWTLDKYNYENVELLVIPHEFSPTDDKSLGSFRFMTHKELAIELGRLWIKTLPVEKVLFPDYLINQQAIDTAKHPIKEYLVQMPNFEEGQNYYTYLDNDVSLFYDGEELWIEETISEIGLKYAPPMAYSDFKQIYTLVKDPHIWVLIERDLWFVNTIYFDR